MFDSNLEHEDITFENVKAALDRSLADTDKAVQGRLTVMNRVPSDPTVMFGYWGHVPGGNSLIRILFVGEDQWRCQAIREELDGEELDPVTQSIVDKLEKQDDDDDDKPIGTYKGKPIYPADKYDRATGRY
jgi:hypothetical protein